MNLPRISSILLAILLLSLGTQAQNALDFDGIDDRASAPNASALIANSNFSMATWVYPTNPAAGWPNFDAFAGFRNEVNADLYLLQLSSSNLEVRFRNSTGTNYDIVYNGLALNTWSHFLVTYNGSLLKLYHNGTAVDSIAASGTITNTTTPFHIGTLPFQATNFDLDGRLDDVCLWNRALSAADVNAWYNACTPDLNDQGLQLCYQFNQGVAGGNNSGITSLTDSKGNINATMTGFGLNGNTSNFIAYGNPALTTLNDSASCTYTYSSPSGTFVWDSSGTYRDTLTNSVGCDSIVAINLTITNGGLDSTFAVTECDFYDSPSGNYTWTSSGSYQDTLVSAAGCDSVLTINLTIDPNTSAQIVDTACGSYTSPSGAFTWTSSGIYPDTISNAFGCDSILTIDLTINNVDTGVTLNGTTLTANASNATYQWVNCNSNFNPIPSQTNQTFVPGVNGDYAVVVTENGCTDTSACVNVIVVSRLDPLQDFAVSVVPNPNNGRFALHLPRVFLELRGRVLDVQGKIWGEMQWENTDRVWVDMDLPAGLYFVELELDGVRKMVKMVRSR